jgi:gliding motility-associated-like protein
MNNQNLLHRLQLLFSVVTGMLLASFQSIAQIPPQQWIQRYGGSSVDIPLVLKMTSDNGTIAGGYTTSKNGDISSNPQREYWDLWLLKLDGCGNRQWSLTLGGSGYESARDIEQTADGGYIVLGETNSTDGGVVSGFGGTKDIWLLKISSAGTLEWQKRLGGSGLDIGNDLYIDASGNFLILASTTSNDGDIRGNHGTGGYTDAVVMKLSPTGSVIWSKCFGGSKNEELLQLTVTNNRIYLAGYTNSIDGDIPPSQKNYDVWFLALDANGNKIYSKIFGGSQNDVAYSMCGASDGSFTLAGYTTSRDGDVTGAKGSQDYWVLNISEAGILNWQKVLGGSDADYANSIINFTGNGFLVGGISYSTDADITNANGSGDYWLVELDASGNIRSQQSWGGSGNDHLRSMLYNPLQNEYYLAGDSDSDDGDFDFEWGYGDADAGIIKLKDPFRELKDSIVCNSSVFIPFTDTLQDQCGFDSIYLVYQPVEISGPLDQLQKRDTIFRGETFQLPSAGNAAVSWQPHPSLSCSNCPNPVASPTETTVYTASNQSPLGCSVLDRFTLVVLNEAIVVTPSAFTPNNDGLNDFFGPLGKVPDEYSLHIFNRFGELVFQSSTMEKKWNGQLKGKPQPSGQYVYLIRYKDMQQNLHQQKGTCLLIR